MGLFLYFAYGSNMSVRRLRKRTPSAVAIGPAEVSGYTLKFDKWSRDGSAKADCERSGNSSDSVHGGLFQVEQRERQALDLAEGLGSGYRAVELEVVTTSGRITALTYLATDKRKGLIPYDWYLRHVITGAQEFRLPEQYVKTIVSIKSKPDPEFARQARELEIYTA